MTADLTLAIDQGTHATRALIFDDHGRPVAEAVEPVSQRHPDSDRFEQDPDEILRSLDTVIDAVIGQVDCTRIAQAGCCVQRSSVLAWDGEGRALTSVLGWQDTRAAAQLATLQADAARVRELTGLRLSAHYGASKLRWLHDHVTVDGVPPPVHYGPLGAFLLRHLVGADLLDEATAARTLLWNLDRRRWEPWLLDRFGIDVNALPEIRPVCGDWGRLRRGNIPLTAVNGDQGAALYALGAPEPGTLSIIVGTGGFLLLPLLGADPPPGWAASGLLRTLTWSDAGQAQFALEGTVNGAGAALDWLTRRCRIDTPHRLIDAGLAAVDEPPLFVNTVGGLGSPWWQPGPASGFPDGAPEAATAVAAVVESVLFLVRRNLDAMRQLDAGPRRIRLGGGLAGSDALCRRLADLCELPVERYPPEASCRGIGWLAAGRPARWSGFDHAAPIEPRPDRRLQARYRRAIEWLPDAGSGA